MSPNEAIFLTATFTAIALLERDLRDDGQHATVRSHRPISSPGLIKTTNSLHSDECNLLCFIRHLFSLGLFGPIPFLVIGSIFLKMFRPMMRYSLQVSNVLATRSIISARRFVIGTTHTFFLSDRSLVRNVYSFVYEASRYSDFWKPMPCMVSPLLRVGGGDGRTCAVVAACHCLCVLMDFPSPLSIVTLSRGASFAGRSRG